MAELKPKQRAMTQAWNPGSKKEMLIAFQQQHAKLVASEPSDRR
jgi:hypothetical protein